MSDISTFKAQFLADLDEIRNRRRRIRIATALVIPGILLGLFLAVFFHSFFLLLILIPVLYLRVVQIQSYSIRCPKCGDFFFRTLPGSSVQSTSRVGAGSIFRTGSQCIHYGFQV